MKYRQKRLYEFLLMNATDHFISKEQICNDLKDLYKRYDEKSSEHNSVAFNQIRNDVRFINKSDVEKIIVSNKHGYKVATHDEAVKFINCRFRRDLSSLKRSWKMQRKVEKNNQSILEDEFPIIKTFIEEVSKHE